jgi:lipid-A-disaccharide synthase
LNSKIAIALPELKTRNSKPKTLLFCAGDLSGDIHAARLAREVLRRHPGWNIYALGGAHLRGAGALLIGDTRDLGVIGFMSAMRVLPRSIWLRHKANRFLKTQKVDAAVLCDWGGFNSRLLKEINRQNVPSLFYFPPRSWQQHGEGGLAIAGMTTRIATPFEWSARRLQNAGANAQWVGHPLLEIVQETRQEYSRSQTRLALGVDENQLLIAVFPGSRPGELRAIAPHLAGAIKLLQQKFPEKLRFVVVVPEGAKTRVQPVFPQATIWENRSAQVLLACDAAMVKSGTIALEAAVCDAPQVVVYDVGLAATAQIYLTGLRQKIPFVAMPNIILNRGFIPELLMENCRAENIAEKMSALIENPDARMAQRREYSHVRAALGENLPYTATERTADILEKMMNAK